MVATTTPPPSAATRQRTFYTVWAGQSVSLLGSQLTGFALALWVFGDTGSTLQLSLVFLAMVAPSIVVYPFAGTLVDRWDRRWAMILSDSGAGLATLTLAVLLLTGTLELWHVYVALAFASVFQAFQFPAYTAATSLLVPKDDYGRAAGLVQLSGGVAAIASPFLAGILLVTVGLWGVVLADLATFLIALGTLSGVRFPRPDVSAAGLKGKGSVWQETRFGFRYLRERRGLFGLLVFFAGWNVVLGFFSVLMIPLLLSIAGEAIVGAAASIGAGGLIVGGLIMSASGGPKRRVRALVATSMATGVAIALMGISPWLPLVVAAIFSVNLALPIASGSSQAIWQAKVDLDVQGRVFALRGMIANMMTPVAFLLAGPLIDGFLEPALLEGGALAASVGVVVGTGAGRGVGFLLVLVGALGLLITSLAFLYAPIRNIEDDLPDVITETSPPTEERPWVEPAVELVGAA
jgi:MFS family permease